MFDGGDSRSWISLLAKGEKVPDAIGFGLSMDSRQGFFPNIAGRKLEWRYNNGKLNALIVRTSGMDPETDESREHLTVIRVDLKQENKGCVIAVINARSATANLDARAIADSARACR